MRQPDDRLPYGRSAPPNYQNFLSHAYQHDKHRILSVWKHLWWPTHQHNTRKHILCTELHVPGPEHRLCAPATGNMRTHSSLFLERFGVRSSAAASRFKISLASKRQPKCTSLLKLLGLRMDQTYDSFSSNSTSSGHLMRTAPAGKIFVHRALFLSLSPSATFNESKHHSQRPASKHNS
jgi:hypothetical protein